MGKRVGISKQQSKPLELIEEAVHLLRRSPPGVFAAYYLGTIPFVLGFLFFWADMSRGFNASSRLIPAALGLVVLYIFMKTMQTVFAGRLRDVITGDSEQKTGFAGIIQTAALHSIYQPWGFVLLPLALLVTVPFGWCFAFFQNLTVLGPSDGNLSIARKKALQQAMLWPAQNHVALGILLFFSLIVLANLYITALYAPQLLKTLLGIETVYTRSGFAYSFNSTFQMILMAGTYLCVDPIVKTFYVLRCYYGRALENGEDLLSEVRSARRLRRSGLLLGLLVVLALLPGPAKAAQPADAVQGPGEISTAGHSPDEIKEAVNTVLARLEYSWRLPRNTQEEQAEPEGFLHDLFRALENWLEKAADSLEAFFQWLEDLFRKLFPGNGTETEEETSGGVLDSAFLYLLLFAGAAGAALVLQKMFRTRAKDEEIQAQEPTKTSADLEDENILASDLPENEWMAMARDLLDREKCAWASGQCTLHLSHTWQTGASSFWQDTKLTANTKGNWHQEARFSWQ